MNLQDAFLNQPRLIEQSFGSRAMPGADYFRKGRVSGINIGDRSASASVRGSEVKPYLTQITLVERGGGAWLTGDCNCVYGTGCKHAAALAYAVARHAKDSGPSKAPAGAALMAEEDAETDRRLERERLKRLLSEREVANRRVPAPPDPWQLFHEELRIAQTLAIEDRPAVPKPVRFVLRSDGFDLLVLPLRGRIGKNDRVTALKPIRIDANRIVERTADDDPLDRGLLLALDPEITVDDADGGRWYVLTGKADKALLAVLETGRVHWQSIDGPVLQLKPVRTLKMGWRIGQDGSQRLMPEVPSELACGVFGEHWGWYIEPEVAAIGPVQVGALKPLVPTLKRAPMAQPERTTVIGEQLQRLKLPVKLPMPAALQMQAAVQVTPVAVLRLHHGKTEFEPSHRLEYVLAEPLLRYGKTLIALNPGDVDVREFDGKVVRRFARDGKYELSLRRFLDQQEFKPGMYYGEDPTRSKFWKRAKPLTAPALIQQWGRQFVEAAAKAGYEVEAAAGFPLETRRIIDEIELEIRDPETGSEWFETRLGIELDGQRIDLAPLLIAALSDPSAWSDGHLRIRLADGREVLIARERLAPILAIVTDLETRKDGKLMVARTRLHAIEVPPDVRLVVGTAAAKLRQQLENFGGLKAVPLPGSFLAELRPYQQQGVSWLQFLRELKFGGVLADDMGLGKTIQVLAHLCVEHAAGRLNDPALVVCPTSVVGNWEAELAKFAPHLTVVVFHGLDRARKAGELAGAHIVLTSYALLARDAELLSKQHFSWAIFDEAQWLKNSASKGFAAAAALNAGQRLCMTGTPIENHLGELKAQFDLAFPGLLGGNKDFLQRFRNPIEKERDSTITALLKRRIGPFLLRRRKTEVATELPPRSTLIQHIELEGPQRDLYESIRVQMESRVREALAERGLQGSRITILDALLKLRQICCHPKLMQTPMAQKVTGSAKLDALCELLPTLIEDGRSVLLFSQFTSMLDLIEKELASRKIDFVRLDGSTTDRKTPVKRFQAGEIPLFLISLKAGGVGLNLTRADTVILYDPWWNPAVEQQAIDRAHRIGQDKPVFVYEMSCVNTVEDKMQKLKERKRAIADAVLNEGEAALERLTGAELLELFAA